MGRLTLQDTDFVENVESDIKNFLENISEKRVLIFPPFNNFRRCLIHQIVENNFQTLKSFSIGEGEERRTVVCFNKEFRSLPPPAVIPKTNSQSSTTTETPVITSPNKNTSESEQENRKKLKRSRTMPSVSIYRPPAARKLEQSANLANIQPREVSNDSPEKSKLKCTEESKEVNQCVRKNESNGVSVFRNAITSIRTQNKVPKSRNVESTNKKNDIETKVGKPEEVLKNTVQNKQKRPDIQVYVPKGRRAANLSNDGTKNSSFSIQNEKSHKNVEPVVHEKDVTLQNDRVETSNGKDKPLPCESEVLCKTPKTQVTPNDTQTESLPKTNSETNNSSQMADKKDSKLISNSTNSVSDKVSENKGSGKPVNSGHLNPDECDWESMFDDSGECLDPSLLDQLTSAVGEVTIEKPKSSYNGYKNKSLDMVADEFPHVIEIYNFPPEFQLQDLMTVFSQFKNSGFEIKWVDDTHALGIFSSSAIVSEVLSFYHPFVKTRSLKEGTALSKMKARRSAEFLLPYKPRPDTCPALARRLVTGALGVKLPTQREEREAEKKILTKAREKKRLEAKQKEDAWEGTFS